MLDQSIWIRLNRLKPSLPRHTHFQIREYKGETWYLLQDQMGGRFHRFNLLAYRLIGFMNGRNNLDQILEAAIESNPANNLEDMPTREDLMELLQYLYVADLLVCDFPPNTQEMFNRKQHKRKQVWNQLLKNPLTWRFSVFNPDKFLDKLLPLARLLATRAMGIIWLLTIAYALLQTASHWQEISSKQIDSILSPQNLFLLWLTYPLLKVVHELGHGLFTKVWGGNVHEFGVVIILGTPLPYVDATAATAFSSKAQRLMVSAAGMAVELFFAAVAIVIWVNVQGGLFKDILFNIVLIGSVSTLFFNGNPLMRFDGYYLLCDVIDQPNLATRAQNQLRYVIKHFGYGIEGLYSHANTLKEAWGLSLYSIAAFIYRLSILATIVYIVVKNFPTLGLILACWIGFFQLILPLIKYCYYLFADKELQKTRRRAVFSTIATFIVFCLFIFYVPVPQTTNAQGVLWLPPDSTVRAESTGLVIETLVRDGDWVDAGQALLSMSNPELNTELQKKIASYKEYKVRYQQAWDQDRSQAKLFEEDLETIQLEIRHLDLQVQNLLVKSKTVGRFKLTKQHQLIGSFVQQGDTLGVVIDDSAPKIRVALKQQEIGLVRKGTSAVKIKLASKPEQSLIGEIVNEVPGGTYSLPSAILGTGGGGAIMIDGSNESLTQSTERVFLVDIALPEENQLSHYGERAYVVFRHPALPIATQVYLRLKQLFIRVVQN